MPIQIRTDEIARTIARLELRIAERFPESSLSTVAGELLRLAEQAQVRAASFRRPNLALRAAIALVLVGILALVGYMTSQLRFVQDSAWDVLSGIEATISGTVLLGAGGIFLVTMESRLNRRRVLAALQELRELAHIVDMHQLAKDPQAIDPLHVATRSSPGRTMSRQELGRYLDYCSELLALIGKVAVFYVHDVHDSIVLGAIDDIEDLTSGLSRKIWQKMIILTSTTAPDKTSARPSEPLGEPRPGPSGESVEGDA